MDTGMSPIRVGIVGLSADRGWASEAHLPALSGLPEFEVTAVATRSRATAEAAASRYGIPCAFGSVEDLARSDVVDMVVVAVRVPAHREVIEAAVAAGKHLYCEWPLGVSVAEARHLTSLVVDSGVRHIIGLQGFEAPGALAVRDVIRSGMIGRVCAVSFTGSGGPHGPVTRAPLAYTVDRASGASILTAHTGHWLATLETVLGPLAAVTGRVATINKEIVLEGSGERRWVTAPDQVAFVGEFGDGALLAFAGQSGVAKSAYHFELRIIGTGGTLVITPARALSLGSTGERRHDSFHFTEWKVRLATPSGDDRLVDLDAATRGDVPRSIADGKVLNVASSYRRFAAAVRSGADVEPDFHTALRYHRVLERLEEASSSRRQRDIRDLSGMGRS